MRMTPVCYWKNVWARRIFLLVTSVPLVVVYVTVGTVDAAMDFAEEYWNDCFLPAWKGK